jgi:hypothetical protein
VYLSDREDVKRAWENIKGSIKTSAKHSLGLYELKQHKPWFDEECSQFLDQRKQAKMQWLNNPNQSTVDNLSNVECEASRHFRNKEKAKIDELETNSKIKNIRDLYKGISDNKKGQQHRTNIVKDKKGDLVTDCHSILARWRNHFCQLLNVRGVNNVRQTEIHTAEPLVLEPSAFEVEMAVEKLQRHKSPHTDKIPAELIKAGGRTVHSDIHKLINSLWNKEELSEEWSDSVIVPVYKKGNKTYCSNFRGLSLLSSS